MGAVVLKEIDGARSIEIEMKDGSVFIEGRNFCLKFDARLFERAVERAMHVVVLRRPDPLPLEDAAVWSAE